MASIVIGMDESAGAAAALRWAVREAELRGWPLTAVLAWGLLDQHHDVAAEDFDPGYDDRDADRALATMIERAVGGDAAATIERRVVCDLPARALIEAAADADLLVVGARGAGGFRGLLLGSVTERCLQHSPSPVAVVRAARKDESEPVAGEPAPERTAAVVVGVDGSEPARRALRWALDEGRARQAPVRVVHAWQPPFLVGYPLGPLAGDADAFADAARDLLDRVVGAEATGGLPMPVEKELVCGGAAAAILEEAKGADLVVVGSRGTGGVTGLLLGSVSHQVARHAPCPVVVVPTRDRTGREPRG